MYSIYVLLDENKMVRYVGRVKNGRQDRRLSEHFYRSDRHEWIHQMKLKGIRPTLEIIDEDGSLENEQFYTEYLKFIGCDLSNKYSGRKKLPPSIRNHSETLKEMYRSGAIRPPYEKGCKKDPSIGKKISATKKRRYETKT